MISEESTSTQLSSQTSVGALTSGLISRNVSKSRNTESERCSKGMPSIRSEIAARRTYGESSMPISCMEPPSVGCQSGQAGTVPIHPQHRTLFVPIAQHDALRG